VQIEINHTTLLLTNHKQKMKKIFIIQLLLSLLAINSANAINITKDFDVNFMVSGQLLTPDIQDPQFITETKTYFDLQTGLQLKVDKFNVIAQTNRILNRPQTANVLTRQGGLPATARIDTKIDIIRLGYQVGKFLPTINLANVQVEEKIYSGSNLLGGKKNSMLIPAVSLYYLVDNNFSVSMDYYFKSKEIFMERAVAISANYAF
jgi:hypothetical protein